MLSFPGFDVGFFTWMALVPLLLFICGSGLKSSSTIAFLCGVVFFTGVFRWILTFPGFTLLHQAILGVYVGVYFGLFALAFGFISRKWGMAPALFGAPFVWVSLEYTRSNMSFVSLPWGLLAHSQYQYPPVIQLASLTGVYGITFLIVMVNAAIAAMMLPLVCKSRKAETPYYERTSGTARAAIVGIAAASILFTLFYGHTTVSEPISGKGVRVSVVQGNIEQAKKWDPQYANFIMQTYANLTQEASKDHPGLIVWPETATPRAINKDPRLYAEVRQIARVSGTYLLLGSAQQQKFEVKGSRQLKYLNSAFLIPPEVQRAKNQRYDKIRLLPFGEYLPLKGTVPWSYVKVPNIGGYVPGKEFTVFQVPDFRFSVAICWESIFPDLVRRFVKNGAQLMVNITNEAWFGKTAAPYQFLSMNVFRAVENRVYLVRCANTGVSCIIDPYGRLVDRVKDEMDRDIFVRGVLSRTVIPFDSKTLYTLYGDWFAWLCLLCSAGFLLIAIFKKNPDRRSPDRP